MSNTGNNGGWDPITSVFGAGRKAKGHKGPIKEFQTVKAFPQKPHPITPCHVSLATTVSHCHHVSKKKAGERCSLARSTVAQMVALTGRKMGVLGLRHTPGHSFID